MNSRSSTSKGAKLLRSLKKNQPPLVRSLNVSRPTHDERVALTKADPKAIADLVLMPRDRVEALEKRIAELERNNRTNSKPSRPTRGISPTLPNQNPKARVQNQSVKRVTKEATPEQPRNKSRPRITPDAVCPDCKTRLTKKLH